VADVSGQGIPAALAMTAFRALLRTKARGDLAPANIASSINQLVPEFTGDKHFITALYAILYALDGGLAYVRLFEYVHKCLESKVTNKFGTKRFSYSVLTFEGFRTINAMVTSV
jgi:hypothetical protein